MSAISLIVALLVVLYIVASLVFGPRRFRRTMQGFALQPTRRARFYVGLVVAQWLGMLIVGFVALSSAVPLSTWGLRAPYYGFLHDLDAPAYTSWLFTLFVIVMVGLFILLGITGAERRLENPDRVARLRRRIKTAEMLPHTTVERRLWLLVSISAGISEEIMYRGFLPWYFLQADNILRLHISFWQAVALATFFFVLAHSYQGWGGMLLALLFGFLCVDIYYLTGSLLLPIALHILMDARIVLIAPLILRALAEDEALPAPQSISTV